ncbi:unnamed protein product [Caenorhabditis auriculariae]|uniref:Uncharacterized protein n=1 Tax=Caenorhabditis auriculariae TaxID=2777116 RepID=A0A8S1HAC1_9PELO|nr:unnamed protein product [Caenorhabditis auriculariae]
MESFPTFIVDAFTTQRFTGNPAAVCLIPRKLEDHEYLKIAAEFNLSETAFPIPEDGKSFTEANRFSLRWFTPKMEVPLCGHATMATSYVLFNEVGNKSEKIIFFTKSGELVVSREAASQNLTMNFPKYGITSVRFKEVENPLGEYFSEFDAPNFLYDLIKCVIPAEVNIESVAYASEAKKLIVVIDEMTSKFEMEQFESDSQKMLSVHPDGDFVRGIIVTFAPKNAQTQGFVDKLGEEYDYACRYFAPWVGILEDPATGSAQCALAPFWAKLRNQQSFYALQCYPSRGAQFRVQLDEDASRVVLGGSAVTVVRGNILLDEPAFY